MHHETMHCYLLALNALYKVHRYPVDFSVGGCWFYAAALLFTSSHITDDDNFLRKMEQIEILNRCIFRDISGHIYRRTRKAGDKSKSDYYTCYIGTCGAKVKSCCGLNVSYGADHTHTIETAKKRLDEMMFDKDLKERLDHSDYKNTKPDELYEMIMKKFNSLDFPQTHKGKKVQIIKSHRSQMKSKQKHQNFEQICGDKMKEGEVNLFFSR